MAPTLVFDIANLMAMIMWLFLIVAPQWKFTKLLRSYKLIPIVLSIMYAIYLVPSIIEQGMLDFSSLDSVMELFTVEKLVLGGWIHYLAFDLLVGMWILEQNDKLKINHLLIIPCLLGSFMMGPVGFLMFMIIRLIKR